MFLALKEMRKEKGRFFLIVSIVVLISYLVFFLTGLAYGLAKDNTTAVEDWNATHVVLKSGTNGNLLSSMMDVEVLDEFSGEDISPINIGRSVAYKNGTEDEKNTIDLVLIGLHQDSKAYPEVIDGELPTTQNEVLASITLQQEDDVQIGDTLVLSMNDRAFVVTGFAEEAKFNVSSVIYTDLEMASAAMMTFIEGDPAEDLVPKGDGPIDGGLDQDGDVDTNKTTQDAVDTEIAVREEAAEQVAQEEAEQAGEEMPEDADAASADAQGASDAQSQATPGIPERIAGVLLHGNTDRTSDSDFDVIPIVDFIQELPGFLAQVLTFGLMIGFLILISTIVLGVFMFIITMQKRQTFGIMKIQGISNGYIGRSVVLQTLIVSTMGMLIGLGLTYLIEYFLPYTVPFRSNILFYGIIGAGIVLISLLGAVFSVRGVAKVDPLEVLE